jgi:hypothetical protein
MQTRLRLYVSFVLGGAVVAALSTKLIGGGDVSAPAAAAFYVAAFGVLAELLTYQMPQGGTGSVALIPFIAAGLLSPDWRAVAAVGSAQAIVELLRRRPPIKAVFNTAQVVLSLSLAIHVYRGLHGTAVTEATGYWSFAAANAAAVLGLLLVYVLVNSITVSGVIAISQERAFFLVWRDNTLLTAAYALASGVLACLLAVIHAKWGMVGATLFMVPLMAFRQFYKTTLQLQQTNRELLELMVKAIEARDPYTSGHSRRVADAATIIARGIGLSAHQVERVRIAALLHDIGKIDEVYAPILRKDGKLTAEEWAIMKTHPIKSAELVATLSDLRDIVGPVRHHHEHWDGRGYPDALAGEQIPLAARIITFADTMDALMTDRPYRRALGEAEVRSEFVKNCGTQFDPTICGQILAPSVWAQLFSRDVEKSAARLHLVTPSKSPTAAAV